MLSDFAALASERKWEPGHDIGHQPKRTKNTRGSHATDEIVARVRSLDSAGHPARDLARRRGRPRPPRRPRPERVRGRRASRREAQARVVLLLSGVSTQLNSFAI